MLKHDKGLLPAIFNEMFIQNSQIHSYNTRQINKMHVPACKSRLSQQTIKFTGIRLWNFMYCKLQTDISVPAYKHKLKDYFITNGFPMIHVI